MTTQGVVSSQAVEGSRRWHFANAVLDDRSFELTVNGEEVEIERKPFEVLRFLLNHAGEVVTKDELYAGVWPGRFLSDTVLTKCVGRLRKALADDDEAIIKTVYGYGYRFVAPVRVEMQRAPEQAHFDFKEGDHPQGRPMWSLQRRLGSGGHGEAWLAHHDKTREQRVFKFAIDEPSLAALKREITLFRFLNDSLGDRVHVVPLLDWNLEQPPCFIEMEYIAGGSLVEWAERSGGLSKIPLAQRIEIAAQIAESLAAVHSVGVLHKDLKPSNVLIEAQGDAPKIRLADFGSGGVLDPKKLESMGITRLGFTKTVAALGESAGGTLMYSAPELLAGQPPTVKADIYALGVLLYQLVVGEFRKAMSPGWEHEVSDEVMRECIGHAAHGDAALRLADAAELALRLRGLEQERETRRREREEKTKREAAERALERLRARRVGLAIAFGVLIVGLAASTLLYVDAREARNRAAASAATSRAVAHFLSKDMFTAASNKPLRNLTVKELLEAASADLPKKVKDDPAAAAELNAALGDAFFAMESYGDSERHLDAALVFYERARGSVFASAVTVTSKLVLVKASLEKLVGEMPRYRAILERGERELGTLAPEVLALRSTLARMRFALLGDWSGALEDYRHLLDVAKSATPADPMLIGDTDVWMGQALLYLGRFTEAEQTLRDAEVRLGAAQGRSPLFSLDAAQQLRAQALLELERFAEAEAEMMREREAIESWVEGDKSSHLLSLQFGVSRLRLRQGRIEEAIALLEDVINRWSKLNDGVVLQPRIWLAEAFRDTGQLDSAEAQLHQALQIRSFPPTHPFYQLARIELADIARLRHQPAQAHEALDSVDQAALEGLGSDHPVMAQLHRVQGLLALQEGQPDVARRELTQALQIYRYRYGASHRFTSRAEAELATCQEEISMSRNRPRSEA